jgi:phosphatidylinositol glycan class K
VAQQIHPDQHSHVIIYMTGHGGDGFFKFHDKEELTSQEFVDTLIDMYINRRFGLLTIILDTCKVGLEATSTFVSRWEPTWLLLDDKV